MARKVAIKKGISTKAIIWIIGIIILLIFLMIGILNLIPTGYGTQTIVNTAVLPGESAENRFMDMFSIGLSIFFLVVGIYLRNQLKVIEDIERRLPDFLHDVAEAGRFGLNLADAIVVASQGRYGDLTSEIRKMAAQIKWGVPVNDALKQFNERVPTPLVQKIVSVISKANEAGGNVADILSMVAHDAKEIYTMELERRVSMSTYLAVIYIAYFVFIATVIILSATFLPEMVTAGKAITSGSFSSMGGASPITISYQLIPQIAFVLMLSVIIHGIFDGLMAGLLETGNVINGMMHSGILLVIGWFLMRFLVPQFNNV